MRPLLALMGFKDPPNAGSWAHAIACRDLADDLGSLCGNDRGEVLAPLHGWQRDMLVEVLAREASRIEDARKSLFSERGLE